MRNLLSIRNFLILLPSLILSACGNTSGTTNTNANSSRVNVTVKGKVDALDNSIGLLDGSVSVGTDIIAVYSVDTSSTPYPYSQPNSANYFNAFQPGGVEFTVGNYKFTSTARTQLTIVNNGTTGADGIFDGWFLDAPNTSVTGPAISADLAGFIGFFDPTATTLSSTAIVAAPQLASWQSKRIGVARFDSTGGNLFIAGEVTEIVVNP